MSTSIKEKSSMVGFKLKGRYFQKLTARADRAGTSHHAQAQKIVESVLDEREEEVLLMRAELDNLRAEVEAIRSGLVTMFTKIVTRGSTETATVEKARAEIERVFARSDKR
jgi:hypothetical protein